MILPGFEFLQAVENRESFFKRVNYFFPKYSHQYKLIERAYNINKDAFREEFRDEGIRYFEHLRAVALIQMDYLRIKDPVIIAAGLSHDLVEDRAEWTEERVAKVLGEQVAELVGWVTKLPSEQFESKEQRNIIYHEKLFYAPREAVLIKLPDRVHNLSTLESCSLEKQKRKVEETKLYYLPLAEKEIILIHELEALIQYYENQFASSN